MSFLAAASGALSAIPGLSGGSDNPQDGQPGVVPGPSSESNQKIKNVAKNQPKLVIKGGGGGGGRKGKGKGKGKGGGGGGGATAAVEPEAVFGGAPSTMLLLGAVLLIVLLIIATVIIKAV